ncbi:hypothetical protein [Bacillus cereus]|uniref:Antirepressor protein C-terminal domain-containing protein n=1 Tax=Bacillus cereus TaxID=1396 RepID=A0A2C1CUL9_BACCE|nr:hypothetical protein [Bacillus cereus]PGS91872.1 hypothetical protein COD09_27130 [Bacillus cereus]
MKLDVEMNEEYAAPGRNDVKSLIPSRNEAKSEIQAKPDAETIDTFAEPSNVLKRQEYIHRIDVLNKVGQLLLLEGLQIATTKQVAQFYKVSPEAIRQVINRHGDELQSDGMYLEKYSEIKDKVTLHRVTLLENGVSYRGTNVFPKRAILRIGMLLRDSEIAKQVRTQLLNIEEATEAPAKVAEINKEKELEMAVGQAFMSGDLAAFAAATAKVAEYKNRHIVKVEAQRDKLASKVTRFIEDENTMTLTDFAAYHVDGVSEARLSRALQIIGVFGERKKPIGKYKEKEWFKIVQKRGYDGIYRPQQVVTQKGVVEIVELIDAYEAKHGGNELW